MTITKRQIAKLIKDNNLKAELSGKGTDWEVEVPNENQRRLFLKAMKTAGVTGFGGFKTGYGAWVYRQNYQDSGDWNDKSSRCHY